MSPKAFRGWLSSKVRKSSFARTSWSLRDLSESPGTKDRPKYVHADSINIKGSTVTLIADGKTYTSDDVNFNNIAKQHEGESHVKPISCYYFDVVDESTGMYLRVWVTEEEMHKVFLHNQSQEL